MFGLGPMEMVLIFLIILLVFGAKRIPEIAQGIGKGITEFKKAARDVTSEIESSNNNNNNVNNQQTNYVRNELKGQRPEDKPSQSSDQQNNTPPQG